MMALSCECDVDFEPDYIYNIEKIERIALTDYRCYGCCKHGHEGDHVRRYTEESRVYEDEFDPDFDEDAEAVYEVTKYERICELCGDMYDNLTELGFCITAERGFITSAMIDYRLNYVKAQDEV